MKAKEAYFKAYVYSTKPQGMLFYTFNQNGTIRIGNTQWMTFLKEDHAYNIGMLEDIEKNIEGFLFWNIGEEADAWLKEKGRKYRQVFSTLAFMQK